MNSSKQQYLSTIRTDSAYPVYRGFIDTIALLGYLLAGVFAIAALVGGLGGMRYSALAGLGTLIIGGILAAIVFLCAKLSKESALILADLADSTVDTNSRVKSI